MKDPNCPKFLESHVQKLKEAWEDTNEKAQKRKKELTGNLMLKQYGHYNILRNFISNIWCAHIFQKLLLQIT